MTAASAFAQYSNRCEVDMIDTRTNRIITTIRSVDYNDGCKEGMKACRKEIRDRNLLNRADCVRAADSGPQYPGPQNPGSQYPGPQTGYDARRMINQGESVIMNSSAKYVTVAGVSFNGLFAVRSTDGWNTITNNVSREQLSVTNGCNMNLCVNDSVINISTARYVTVVGLSYSDRFVTKSTDGWNTLTTNQERRLLAETKGCISSRYAQICVGNQVINQQNRYSTVVGVQQDGRVVLKSTDGWNTLTTNVDPTNLVITR
jgi:hypothetical protein